MIAWKMLEFSRLEKQYRVQVEDSIQAINGTITGVHAGSNMSNVGYRGT
jgi:heterodisulfide reductase subunit A-like polyferredoxin